MMKKYRFTIGIDLIAKNENQLDEKIVDFLIKAQESDSLVNFLINNSVMWNSEELGEVLDNTVSLTDWLMSYYKKKGIN